MKKPHEVRGQGDHEGGAQSKTPVDHAKRIADAMMLREIYLELIGRKDKAEMRGVRIA